MAIFHLSVKAISRSAGRSATAAAAYRAGVEIKDERTGEVHNYKRKRGVESSSLVLPVGAPEWASDREQLWNAVELAETRKNSTVAREFEVAIPHELSRSGRKQLALTFAREIVNEHGCAADVSVHQPDRKGDSKNRHAHILISTRRLTPDGFSEKTRELDDKKTGSKLVEKWRERWAELANESLKKEGIDARIDHRSLKDQGITDREPSVHLGVNAVGFERRTGEKSRVRASLEQREERRKEINSLRSSEDSVSELIDAESKRMALPEGWLEIPKAPPRKRLPPTPEDFLEARIAMSGEAITLDQLPTIDEIPSLDDLILRGFEEEIDEQVELEIEAQPAEEVEEKDELDKVLESLEILDLPPELQEEIANLIRGMNQEERREFAAMLHPDFNLDAERERLEAAERAEREAAQERERLATAQREAAERAERVAQERERIAAEQREAAAYREAQEEAERTEQRRQEFIAELLDEQKALKDHERQLRNQLSQIPEPEPFNPNFERYHREQTIKQEINSLARQTGKPPAYEEGGYDPWDRRRFHAQQAGNKAEVKMWLDAIAERDRMFAEKMAADTSARKAAHDRKSADIYERRNPLIEAIEAVLERLAEIVETLGWLGYEPPLQQQQKPLQQQERPPVQQQQKQPRRGRGRG